MAHTFDSGSIVIGATTSVTSSFTPGAGSTVLVVGLAINTATARTGGNPTYAGRTLTKAGATATATTVASSELWYLLDPPVAAAANIIIPNTGGRTMTVISSTYKAALGMRTVLDNHGLASGNSTNPTVSLTTGGRGDVLTSIISCNNGALTAGRTLLYTGISTNRYGAEYNLQVNPGALALNWTATTGRWATVAASFREILNPPSRAMTGVGT